MLTKFSFCRQFQQFDYNTTQGYGMETPGQLASSQPAYPGSIMTPSTSPYEEATPVNSYEDEPPLMEGNQTCISQTLFSEGKQDIVMN